MLLKSLTFFLFLLLALNLLPVSDIKAASLATEQKGRILLQVEANGEAWYVNPADLKRYYLGRPEDAFALMRELGLGISNSNLSKIQVAEANLINGVDTDNDGLSDIFEDAIGTDKNSSDTDTDGFGDKDELLRNYNPSGSGELKIDQSFSRSQLGKIFLQVEQNGEAWYINPTDLKRYYLGRPTDAFNVMRSLGLGISNNDLEQIPAADLYSSSLLKVMEKSIHDLINQQRTNNGLSSLTWNDDVSNVAREHSNNLAAENIALINSSVKCNLPLIHHEGLDQDFGLYHQDRLKSREVYYLSANAENIALMPVVKNGKYYYDNNQAESEITNCSSFFNDINDSFKQKLAEAQSADDKMKIIEAEISDRTELVANQPIIELFEVTKNSISEVEQNTVTGWMNSPGHRANILTAGYNEAGIGIAEVKEYLIITQVFITRVDCGYKTGSCCEKEGYYPYCYNPYTCSAGVCAE